MDEQTQISEPKKGMNPMVIVGVVILVLIVAGGIYLGTKKNSSQQQIAQQAATPTVASAVTPSGLPSTSPAATGTATTTPSVAGVAIQSITVNGGNYYFKPNKITVKKGDAVKITFVNDGGFHDFVLDGYNVKTDIIGSGKTQTVSFTADKAGAFAYYCSVGNHRAMGMQGTLVVQ